MTIQQMTPETIAKLEAAVQNAKAALDACPDPSTFRYPPPASLRTETDRQRNGLVRAVAEAERALKQARNDHHNQAIYQELSASYAANMAKNAAEQAAQELARRGESEAAFKRQAENVYIQNGGTALEFARAWPAMREKLLEQKTLAALSQDNGSLVDQYIARRNQASS